MNDLENDIQKAITDNKEINIQMNSQRIPIYDKGTIVTTKNNNQTWLKVSTEHDDTYYNISLCEKIEVVIPTK